VHKVLLFTGKGGTGKTVIAAATALQSARLGYKTVVVSTDPAHSLADSLDLDLGPEPREILLDLWAQESDVLYNMKRQWNRVQRWLTAIFMEHGLNRMEAEEVAVLPGFDELGSLIWVSELYKSAQYEVIVVDCAPTAETLRLLSVPEVGQWWVNKFLQPLSKAERLPSVLRYGADAVFDMPLPEKEVVRDFYDLFGEIKEISSLVTNPEVTSLRLVLNPEKMVIKETQRAYTYFNFYGYSVDSVICNKLIPQEAEGSYCEELRRTQQKYLKLIEEGFCPLPILKLPMLKSEVVGVAALQEIAALLYGQTNPSEALITERTFVIEQDKESTDYLLKLKVPFISKTNVPPLIRVGEELVIQVSNWKRNILLPKELQEREISGAKLTDDQWLVIRFKREGDLSPNASRVLGKR
jgi:arsenite-transporting ATPase